MNEKRECPDVEQNPGIIPNCPVAPPDDPVMAIAVKEEPPMRWRELLAIVLLVVLSDLTIYRGQGFAGYALLMATAPLLLAIGAPRPRWKDASFPLYRTKTSGGARDSHISEPFKLSASVLIVAAMLAVLAVKMLWCGSVLQIAVGFALLAAFAAAISGVCPYFYEVLVLVTQIIPAGFGGLSHYERCLTKRLRGSDGAGSTGRGSRWLSVALPLGALVAFGMLFILANPGLMVAFGESVQRFFQAVRDWLMRFSPSLPEVLVWIAALWISVGLLRPIVGRMLPKEDSDDEPPAEEESAPAPLYAALRNTLLVIIVLFAVYLTFEFKTLWFRVFPEGFYYSGYAHEGAAWLTAALALSTAVLSLVFRGRVLGDPRLPRLRWLAWIWSLENILLAVAVYHRLYIYIGFNGMTRMRMVGIFGMSAVIAGFILVVWKILRNRNFVWLVRRHLWTVAIAVYLFAITPIDAIVTSHNVRRILSGDPAPSVQISVHPIDSEGILFLEPLVGCDNKIIREGVRAMLAERQLEAESLAARREREGWTAFQLADRIVLNALVNNSGDWAEYKDHDRRNAALQRFHDYAYQWY